MSVSAATSSTAASAAAAGTAAAATTAAGSGSGVGVGVGALTGHGGPERPRVTRAQLLLAAGAMAGIQVCYAVQINHGSSALLALGLDEASVSLAWLAGPLSGLIVQPIVGIASDACTSRLGRRTPFLIGGMFFTATALLVFPNAKPIANALLPRAAAAASAARLALAIAIFTFFLLDFAIQAIQAPLRALITDMAAPGGLLPVGNAYLALFVGLGNLVGSLLSSAKLTDFLPAFRTDVQALFTLAALLLVLSVSLCVATVKEIPLPPPGSVAIIDLEDFSPPAVPPARRIRAASLAPPAAVSSRATPDDTCDMDTDGLGVAILRHDSQQALLGAGDGASTASFGERGNARSVRRKAGVLANAYRILRDAPRPFWRVFAVQLFTWFGFFSLFVFVNAWVGNNIFLGRGNAPADSPERARFEEGVRLGGVGNTLTALVTILYSQITSPMMERIGILPTYAFSQLVEAICLLTARFIRGSPGQAHPSFMLKLAAVLDIGAFGIVWATTMGVPWAIIGKALNEDPAYQPRVGLFTTVFNASQSFPQLFVAFGSPLILRHFNNDVSAVMFTGGILALVGLILILVLRVDLFSDGQSMMFANGDSGMVEPGDSAVLEGIHVESKRNMYSSSSSPGI